MLICLTLHCIVTQGLCLHCCIVIKQVVSCCRLVSDRLTEVEHTETQQATTELYVADFSFKSYMYCY